MSAFSKPHPLFNALACSLCLLLAFSGCAYNTVVQIKEPYDKKIRPGDGVKITTASGARYSGRVAYVDRTVVVLRTPRQTRNLRPVEVAQFGTTIQWVEVKNVKVAGTLDSRGKLISNEEIRVNLRTKNARKMLVNIGLLGTAVSFLAGVEFQDSISPASTDASFDGHGKARLAFWSMFAGGALASALAGYLIGVRMDRQIAIARIERQRAAALDAKLDSLRQSLNPPAPVPASP